VFPTWQGVLAQIAAAAFVVGSYFAAESVRKRRREARFTSTVAPSPTAVPVHDAVPEPAGTR
jgi:hypothetical protein